MRVVRFCMGFLLVDLEVRGRGSGSIRASDSAGTSKTKVSINHRPFWNLLFWLFKGNFKVSSGIG